MTIPPYIPESRLDGCDIIDINYELQFIVDIESSRGITLTIPLVIGTGHTPSSPDILRGSGVPNSEEYVPNGKTHSSWDPMSGIDKPPEKPHRESAYIHDISDVNANIEEEDDKDKEFRRPMAPGGTRENPLYSAADN